MLKTGQIISVLLLLLSQSLLADSVSKWLPLNLSNEEGLSNSAITCVFQDSEGLMWFGSWDGLNRYDGSEIKVFKPNIFESKSISSNIIRNIIEDKDHNMWVLTNKGINRYLSNTMNFQSYFAGKEYIPVREQNIMASIGPDSGLYISLFGFGIYNYDQEIDDFHQTVLPEISVETQKNIIGVSGGKGDKLFLISRNGRLFAFDKKKEFNKLYEKDLAEYAGINIEKHWFIQGKDKAFLAIAIEAGGLFVLNLESLEISRIGENDESLTVTTINSSPENNEFWLGSDDGSVYKLMLRDEPELARMDQFMTDLSALKVKIWTIQQTGPDLLWIGTDGNGIYRYIIHGKPFFNIRRGSYESGSLGHNIVRSVLKDKDDNLWVGTRGDGVNRISSQNGERFSFTIDNGLSNNAVLSLKQDEQENIWIGVDGEGIDMFEYSSGKFFHFPEDFVNGNDREFGYVYSICIDVFGEIWLGTSGFGVVNIKVVKNEQGRYFLEKYNQLSYQSAGMGIKSNIVYSIIEERPNILWLGTRGGGLHRLNTLNNSFEYYGISENGEDGLIDDDVLSLYFSPEKKMWIGTSGGLSQINLSYRPYKFIHYTEGNGMPNNTVHGIMRDSEKDIWISTNQGLSKLDVENGIFQNYNKADGLINSEYTDGAFFNDTMSNILYFGGTQGLDWFNPTEIRPSNNFPPIFLGQLRLSNNLIIPGDSTGILSQALNNTKEIHLKYNQNFFSVSFTTLNYYNSNKCQFAYYLEEFDYGWNYVGAQRTASFTNVPPGKYSLNIKASNEDGIYGEEMRQIQIQIHPPFWNTIFAYFVYLILLSLILWLIINFYKQRAIEKRAVELEKLERLKADEINRYKLQFFTNIAHEFRTPLTLILAPAAILDEKLDAKKKLGKYARSVYQNANRLQKLISELIEFRKVETKNMSLAVGKYELVQYISNLTRAFEVYTKLNGIDLHFIHHQPVVDAWIDAEKFEKILLNLVSNAIKYTPEGGRIEIELKEQEEHIHLMVRDNGIGIPFEYLDKIFDRFYHHGKDIHDTVGSKESGGVGLALTRSLVELHKGKIKAVNLIKGGSEFQVVIPNNRESFENDLVDKIQIPSSEKIALRVAQELQIKHVFGNEKEIIDPEKDNRKYSLLVVDDNYQVCDLLESLLSEDYRISKAHDGKSALELLKKESIDLVISDIVMPEMDGLELTKAIKSDIFSSHIPVILLTAKGEISDRIEGLEMGADSYIPKPFHPKHLLVRIERLISNIEKLRKNFTEYNQNPSRSEVLEGLSAGDQKLISELIEYIEENMQDVNLNAESLTDKMAMSKTQLYRKIKALTGLTPHELINSLRLKRAAAELKLGDKTVSEIFYETGFNSRSYFYQKFKEAYGVPPGDFQ